MKAEKLSLSGVLGSLVSMQMFAPTEMSLQQSVVTPGQYLYPGKASWVAFSHLKNVTILHASQTVGYPKVTPIINRIPIST